jgi:hypothetical protein
VGRTRTAWRRSVAQPSGPAQRMSRRQALALLSSLAVAVAVVGVAAALVSPNRARSFDLIHGSIFLADDRAPVAIDLATGKPTVRLVGANSQVRATNTADLSVVPLTASTLLLNSATGEFNLVDGTGFVVKTTAGGVPLPKQAGATTAMAVAAGNAAYVVRGGTANTSVFLVNTATVQSATRSGARITPRGSAVLTQPSNPAPGMAVSANGQLWLLTGTSDARTLRQLSVPPESQTGATLTAASRGTVSGLAALASVPAGNGGDQVTMATAGELQQFTGPDASRRTLAVSGLTGVDQILPASNASSGVAFLFHANNGWNLVTASPESATAAVHALKGIPPTAQLATPAVSSGSLYTMDRATSAALWQISPDGTVKSLPGATGYPVPKDSRGRALEVADFGDAQVVAQRSRVLFNSPGHVLALAVFTDGSHPPMVIDKSSAADLNAAGGASAITAQHNNGLKKTAPAKAPQQQKAPTPTAPAVNNKVRCKTTTQTPHVPSITTATSASRSVLLNWTYPLLDSQDCVPSTYQIIVRTLTDGSPSAPGQVSVQGQQQVNLTGLYPSTRYQISVTAYLNGRGTSSPVVIVTTGPEGPAAPTGVTATTDSGGNWTIAWKACGSVKNGCVPASNWSVIPHFCDGLGLSSPPAPLPVAGDDTLSSFSTSFSGGTSLLGRGLSFSVQGVSAAGNVGTTSASSGCAYSWAPPDQAAMHLSASVPAQTSLGGTTSSTFTLDLGRSPAVATGGVGGQITFQLLVGSRVVQSMGPGTATTASFTGIKAGTSYTGKAIVTPPRHNEAAVTVGPVTVATRSNWPAIAISSAKVTQDSQDPRTGELSVTLSGLSSAAANGERFRLTDGSSFYCGNTAMSLSTPGPFDPSTVTVTAQVNLLQYFGDCRVGLQLVEDAGGSSDPPVFGGTQSPTATASVSMPGLPTGGVSPSDFTAAWDPQADDRGYSTITVRTVGNDPSLLFVLSWSETVSDGVYDNCGFADDTPPVTMEIARTCVADKGGDATAWTATVSYRSLGQSQPKTVTVKVTGTPPTYVAPTPSGSATSTPTPSPSPSGS